MFSERITSLLPIGIIAVKGEFLKGDIVRIVDQQGAKIGLGKAEYSAVNASEKIGKNGQKPLVHYDYLYISELN